MKQIREIIEEIIRNLEYSSPNKDIVNQMCSDTLELLFAYVLCVEEKKNVRGSVVESGKVYDLIFSNCDCPIHTEAGIESNRLCECSRQSMICVFKELLPERRFHIECIKSILSGDEVCCHRIIFDD